MFSADNCSALKQAIEAGGGLQCATARKLRATMFSGDDFARLWSGEKERIVPDVDASEVNRPQVGGATATAVGYVGTLRVDIPAGAEATAADVQDIRRFGTPQINPGETVSVRFQRATLDHFLKQMLSGALGLNYVVADDLQSTITFRTEAPLPKGQILQVVRDILGRKGLVIKNMNGVFHIDRAESLAMTEAASRAGRDGDQMTRLIKLPRGNASEIMGIVRQLVPEDVSLVAASRGDLIVKAATQGDLNSVSELVNSLAKGGVGDDRVAILPLARASPMRVAAQVGDFYRARLGGAGPDSVTVIPLEAQNAILVGTRDPKIMAGVRALAAQLDKTSTDEMTVRIVPLIHLGAEETAQRLSAIMSNKGAGSSIAISSAGETRAQSRSTAQPLGEARAPSTSDSPYGSLQASSEKNGGVGASTRLSRLTSPVNPSSHPTAVASDLESIPDLSNIRFEPDARNNALLVFSTFAAFKRVQQIVKALDVPQAQVVIEATIAEVTLTDDLQFGVQTFLSGQGFTARNANSQTAAESGGAGTFANIGFSVGNVRANVILQALQSVTTVKIISSPYLTVVDKKTARLVIGDQIPFAQSTQTSSNAGTTTITESIQTKDTGVVLEVTPKINANNSVSLTVDQQITKPADSAFQGNKTPVISTRQVKSDILVQSGRTFVLGGLIQERFDRTDVGTPGLSSVPLIGDLFKPQQQNRMSRVELLVMITPRVVRESSDIERITRLLRDQLHVR